MGTDALMGGFLQKTCNRCGAVKLYQDLEEVTWAIQMVAPDQEDLYYVCAECYRRLLECIRDFLEDS